MNKHFIASTATIGCLVLASLVPALGAVNLNVRDFDSACGVGQHNCRGAFQRALQAAGKAGGGTVLVPPGVYILDFPEVANDAHSGPPILPTSIIAVPPNVAIQGHIGRNGVPDSVIEWKVASMPVFVFANASNSGMQNLHLRFTGTTPTQYPYGDIALLRALGLQPAFPHLAQMSGGLYEMFSFAMIFGSDHCTFDHLLFDSASQDNQHAMGFAINIKGSGIATGANLAGLSRAADGNRITNIQLRDYIMGFMIYAQSNLLIEHIDADWRGSSKQIAPGHVIYFNTGSLFQPGGAVKHTPNTNVIVRDLVEGPHTLDNIVALGTLALKYIDGGTFQHIVSTHPAGLIQSLVAVRNVTFQDMHWSSDADVCAEPEAQACGVPVINSLDTEDANENLTFQNMTFKSTIEPIGVQICGHAVSVDGLTIEAPPILAKNQTNTGSMLLIKNSDGVQIKNYSFIPRLTSVEPQRKYNTPIGCFGHCSNVTGDAAVKWPKGVPPPVATHQLLRAVVQDQRPEARNSLKTHVEPQSAAH